MESFENIRVVDLSENIAGQFCGRMLADQGADVILVEPPTGSVVRRVSPTAEDDQGHSFVFENVNRGKRSVTIDPESHEGRLELQDLLDTADIVIAGAEFGPEPDRDYALVRVSDFGTNGTLAGWQGSEMIHQALSGVMYETGKASKRPLYGCGYRSYHAAGVAAYISAVTELFARRRGRPTQDAEVQVAETAATMNYCRVTQYDYSHIYDRRGGTKRPMAFVKCKDGWICIFPAGSRWQKVCEVLGATELVDDPELATSLGRIKRWRDIIDVFETKVADRLADDVVAAVQGVGGVASRVYTPHDLLASQQLASRGYWRRTAEGHLTLGPMFRISKAKDPLPTDAPIRGTVDVAL